MNIVSERHIFEDADLNVLGEGGLGGEIFPGAHLDFHLDFSPLQTEELRMQGRLKENGRLKSPAGIFLALGVDYHTKDQISIRTAKKQWESYPRREFLAELCHLVRDKYGVIIAPKGFGLDVKFPETAVFTYHVVDDIIQPGLELSHFGKVYR